MTRPPNILWMVADHQAHANRPGIARSLPLQSRLAAQGTRFSRAYTALPICSPSRATMLTGLYPHNHGLTENDGRFGGRAGLEPTDWLINQSLAKTGYRCGWFGKWHLSNSMPASDFGFEGFSLSGYGYPFNTPEYRAYLDRKGLIAPVGEIELPGESGLSSGTKINLCSASDWFDYETGTAIIDGPAETHEAFFVADLAKTWLRESGDTPFFLRVDTWGPHPPYLVAPPFDTMFEDVETAASPNLSHDLAGRPMHHGEYRDYWRDTFAEGADDFALLSRRALQQAALCETALAELLDALDETGQADNTIVIFCADHGDAVASNGGVANKGGLMVEETLRIPLLISGPEILSELERPDLVSNVDIVPTLLQASGLHRSGLDGESLWPLLLGGPAPQRAGLMSEHYGLHIPVMQRAWHAGNWKLVVQENGFRELYNLATDPCEMNNLANQPEHDNKARRMEQELVAEMKRSRDPAAKKLPIQS